MRPRIRSRGWTIFVVVVSAGLVLGGFGGLVVIREAFPGDALPTLLFLVLLGLVTFGFFAGPGIVYVARKRIPSIQKALPGDAIAWVRAHLYLPILALVAAYVHATIAPFRSGWSSGKLTLAIGVLVAVAGLIRHRLISIQAEARNVDIEIGKIVADQPREFRQLVREYREGERSLEGTDQAMASLPDAQRQDWAQVRALSLNVERNFPRGGGQTQTMRHEKLWRAVHAPLTVVLFLFLGYHVVDALNLGRAVRSDRKDEFASSSSCGGCHSDIYEEWKRSAMAHAQTSQVMLSQLPITLEANEILADELGDDQADLLEANGKVCINCHAQIGARFADADALLPLDQSASGGVGGGGEAVQSDGVGCVVCHTQAHPPTENSGAGELDVGTTSALSYGTQYGPLFDDPSPLPVSAHDMETSDDLWSDPIASSQLCGACHNVSIDIDGDGEDPLDDVEDDLVLQTTYDEWQEYLDSFDGGDDEFVGPIGCTECHMPSEGSNPVVDYAPGALPVPNRDSARHSFVGVDYDLADGAYSGDELDQLLEERKELLESAITLQIDDQGTVDGDVFAADVTVSNNGLGHRFPTGFAFARQFWLEVSAETVDGEEVPLAVPDGFPGDVPEVSGHIDDPTEDLPQCDMLDVADEVGLDPDGVGNSEIAFAAAFPVGECDPYLVNFQKILTDGDANDDGEFTEVPFQSFLPDIVKNRVRAFDPIDGTFGTQEVAALETPIVDEDASTATFGYDFDTSAIDDGTEVVVTATLHLRHLPPDFIRALDDLLDDVDDVPAAADIDADDLLDRLVVTDVVTVQSGDGEVLACAGPQNDGGSVLDCE